MPQGSVGGDSLKNHAGWPAPFSVVPVEDDGSRCGCPSSSPTPSPAWKRVRAGAVSSSCLLKQVFVRHQAIEGHPQMVLLRPAPPERLVEDAVTCACRRPPSAFRPRPAPRQVAALQCPCCAAVLCWKGGQRASRHVPEDTTPHVDLTSVCSSSSCVNSQWKLDVKCGKWEGGILFF